MDHGALPESAAEPGVTAAQWVRAWRGLACVFWGLPLSAVLFFGAVDLVWWQRVPMPPYVIGAVVVSVGSLLLWRARLPDRRWGADSRNAVLAAGLLLYFAPLVRWYTFLERSGWHYLLNVAGLLAAVVWMVWLFNRLAGRVGLLVGDEVMAAESFLCGWLAAGMATAPMVLAAILGSYLAVRDETRLAAQVHVAHQQSGTWVPAFVLLPLSLTMVSVWKAKERCARVLASAQLAAGAGIAASPTSARGRP